MLDSSFVFTLIVVVNACGLTVSRRIRVRICQQRTDRCQYCPNIKDRAPLILEDIQTNSTVIINIRVEYFWNKLNLWRPCWILIIELKCEFKETTFPNGAFGSFNIGCPIIDVILAWGSIDSWINLTTEFLKIFYESLFSWLHV